MTAHVIEPVVIPLLGGRELRLVPQECGEGRYVVFVATYRPTGAGTFECENADPVCIPDLSLPLLAAAGNRLAARLEKARARASERTLWAP